MKKTSKITKEKIEEIKKIPIGYPKLTIEFYFWIGLISALLLRATYLLEPFNALSAKLAWYVGIGGYMLFFIHRHRVSVRRKNTVKSLGLLEKIKNHEKLDIVDYNALEYVLWSLSVSKEKLNYVIIIIFSCFAIISALTLEFLL